ncbi:MAG: radical SAM protein [Sphaerochaetaceae bacterium]|nr:radical SAM protein [Sphaerochaetaceae bacterium]
MVYEKLLCYTVLGFMERIIEIHCCASEKSSMSFPLGALCIQSVIKAEESLPESKLIQHYLYENPKEAARETAKREPIVVGISLYIWNNLWFEDFSKELASLSPNTIIFAGGPQVTSFIGSFPSYLHFAIIGEGEVSTIEALKKIDFSLPSSAKEIYGPGIISQKYPISEASPLPDLNILPSVFLSGTADPIIDQYEDVLWEMTRGCPYHCAFCFESRGKRTVRDYPLERIEQELNYFIEHNISNVFVLDPTFNLNSQRAKKILSFLINKAPKEMHFTFEIRGELVDEEMAKMFSILNCSLQIGLQSANEEVLNAIGRPFNKKEFQKKVGLLEKYEVAFGLDIIIGLPLDNFTSFKETISYAIDLRPSNIDCFILSVLSGTTLEQQVKTFGLVTDNSYQHNVIETPSFSKEEIERALEIRNGMDLFYTKGQSCMWIHCILETLNISPWNLFSLFTKWMKQTNRTEEEDIWILQDDFVTSLFEKTGNTKLIPPIKSFMELHQGLCYVNDCLEPVELDLSYTPDELALLDTMSLSQFVKTHRFHRKTYTLYIEDGEIRFV